MTTQEYLNILESGSTPDTGSMISYGLTNAATVMLVVFAVLGILYLILTLSGAIFSNMGKPKAPKAEKKPHTAPASKKEAAVVSDEIVAVLEAAVQAAKNDSEIIAVLTAAVHAARAEAGETGAFRVVSFRRR